MKLPDLQFVWRNFSSGVWIGALGIGFFVEVVGFEEVGLAVPWFVNKDESLVEVSDFEDVGLSGFVNKDDKFPFEAALLEEHDISQQQSQRGRIRSELFWFRELDI